MASGKHAFMAHVARCAGSFILWPGVHVLFRRFWGKTARANGFVKLGRFYFRLRAQFVPQQLHALFVLAQRRRQTVGRGVQTH